ncbi:phosphatidate cytidylyltransferase [Aquabacterium sp. J223]|uniref:phosphatidate cytidylyltransferase n=1 Tax=Aquabacterium sp. J223 TaxID=2898431 RepID=UPI0021ADB40E|nr:phosphatidate cytidylyltransferase [Aquabacterium sp. J223]UUX97037.1 phosphatidate cytidylyltransferase [Aquabacterium sp. J223]
MLKQRILTAVVLLALLLPALASTATWPFALLTLVLIGAAGWEWGRLNQWSAPAAVAGGVVLALACAASVGAADDLRLPAAVWGVVALLWVVGGALVLRGGVSSWPRVPRALRGVLGLLLLYAAWAAMVQAKSVGLNFLLSVFVLVWAADIAAYFGGRAFGRRKLAPGISPGKSWEGVFSGWLGVALLAALWLWVDRRFNVDSASVYSRLQQQGGTAWLVVGAWALAGLSVVGDLFESLVKRAAGAKDSSRLLPGHGGVLDRIDALLPVFPAAMALAAW